MTAEDIRHGLRDDPREDSRPVADLLSGLEDLGVQLWLEDTQLRYRAPRGVMTAERLASLRSRKQEISSLLRAGEAGVRVEHDEAGRYRPFPLTDVQAAYLTGRSPTLPYGGVGCHGYGELRFDGVDVDRLQEAWRWLVGRHDMLRVTVGADGSQQVREPGPLAPVPVRDLGPVPPEQLAAAVEETRAALSHRVYRPGDEPLWDLRLTVGDGVGVLHFSLDFLIADFVSIHVLLGELETAYRDSSRPPPPSITFRDVLLAQRSRRDGPAARRDRDWWFARLDSLPGPPELPVRNDLQPPPRFERHALTLDEPEWAALSGRARRHGVTPTCAVLTAYADVLRRWSRRAALTVNVTVLNRPPVHPEIGSVVGDFTSVDLLAVPHEEGRAFGERAAAVQAQLWEDLDHGLCNGIEVLRERRRRTGEPALFPVVFTSSIGLGAGARAPSGGLGRLVHGISQTPQVWLDCQVMEMGPALSANWDVRCGVFPDGLVAAMFAMFAAQLRALACGDDAWASGAAVPVPADQLALRPPRTAAVTSGLRLLQDGILEQCRVRPAAPAVVTAARALTFGELQARASAVTAALDAVLPPGGVVAIEMDKGWEQVVAVLGVLAGGRAYVPVDTSQPVARRERIVADAGAVAVLTQSWLRSAGDEHSELPVVAVDTLAPAGPAAVAAAPAVSVDPDDLAYVIYTSGSTGAPKGVMVTHRAALGTVEDITERFAVTASDRVLGLANLGFDLSVYDLFGVLGAGGAVVLPDAARRGDPGHWAELTRRFDVTLWNSVPAQLEMLAAYLAAEPSVTLPLRLALLSGDWIPVTLPDTIRDRLPGLRVVSLGGATEAAIWSIWHPVEQVDPGAPSIPYGRPLRGQTVEVLGPDLAPVPDLVVGEIYIGGNGLALGYHGDPERTAQRFVRHPDGRRLYRTGDLGRYLPDGDIEFGGREDSQVKIRGHRVELAEVEAALLAHPAVAAAAVVPVGTRPDPVRLAAFVELAAAPGGSAWSPGADRLREAAVTAAAPLRASVDEDGMLAFAEELDHTGLLQMLATLRGCGLFGTPEDGSTAEEVLAAAAVAPRHHRLVRRWLRALDENGLLHREPGTGCYHRVAGTDADAAAVAAGWARVTELTPAVEQRTELMDYFRTAAAHLPELVSGALDPLTLLFPGGRTEIHEVAYTAMFLSRYVNRLLTAVAGELAASAPLRVLEVGAGVGGTSVEILPVLAGQDVEYLFTDVSEFFLNNARDRYAEYPWVDFARFDLNEDYRRQGLRPGRFEVVVCANVLHYARDADRTVAALRELLVPGGWLLFIEATRDSYQIMTSMEFLFDEGSGQFTDARQAEEQTFLTRSQWHDVLVGAEADAILSLPDDDRITDRMGMQVFAARFGSDWAALPRPELERHLTAELPDHMLPSEIEMVERLPLTDNGKVDRRALAAWLAAEQGEYRAGGTGGGGGAPVGELEELLADVWRRQLRVESVGRDQTFFALGGDSLLAAQLATDLWEHVPGANTLPYDDVLRLLLENATIVSIAAALGQACAPAPAGAASPLVELGEGPGRVVLVHPGTGDLGWYAPLVAALGGRCGLTGLVVPEAVDHLAADQVTMVEQVAVGYVAALRAAGHDRVRLVGAHAGAALAAEVARQLTEIGGVVERLVVVAPLAGAGPGEPPSLTDDDPGSRARTLYGHAARAAAGAELLPFAGDVVLVRPGGSAHETDPAAVEDDWQEVCLGELTVLDVDGDEGTCLAHAAAAVADLLVDG